jgi:hypothetical protein
MRLPHGTGRCADCLPVRKNKIEPVLYQKKQEYLLTKKGGLLRETASPGDDQAKEFLEEVKK